MRRGLQPISPLLRMPLDTVSDRVSKAILKMVQSSKDIFNENKLSLLKGGGIIRCLIILTSVKMYVRRKRYKRK